MFHSTKQFWQTIELLKLYEVHPELRKKALPIELDGCPIKRGELPTDRVLRLLWRAMQDWKQKPRWLANSDVPHLFDGKSESEIRRLSKEPVAIRKALAVAEILDIVTRPEIAERAGTLRIHSDELIVGCIPPYSVGQGKELVGYLTPDEELSAGLNGLTDRAPFGHVTPSYETLLKKGVQGLIRDCERKLKTASGKRATFYRSVIIALEGVCLFARRYESAARSLASKFKGTDDEKEANLNALADRLKRTPSRAPRSFLEAVQCLYLFHCALHTSGEITSIGRLDQLLYPFLENDGIGDNEAQEILDCLWIKFGERAIHNRNHMEDRFTFCDGALLGSKMPANYDQGALANQWMQQVTIGGVAATNDKVPVDASNKLTLLCLNASRRLPLNSPTLDFRVHKKTPERLLKAAAKTILSGGAHPVILNDDRIIPALHKESQGRVSLKSARNYACDGCYETHFSGETEFSFYYVPALDVLEKTLNRGAGIAMAGAVHLRGYKSGLRTRPAIEFECFQDLWQVLSQHIEFESHRFFSGIYNFYGEKEGVAPSPLLSSLIDGCLRTGRDMSGGGARYKMVSPLMTGISTCTDSLFAIKHLVFDRKAVSMPEYLACLYSNWGEEEVPVGLSIATPRIEKIRRIAMKLPKFGHGNEDVDRIGKDLTNLFCDIVNSTMRHPIHQTKLSALKKIYGKDFELLITPGVGTFEQYVFAGGFVGATPDGRKSRQPIESDLSPAPFYQDLEVKSSQHPRQIHIENGLKSYSDSSFDRFSDGAPVDVNLAEDFSEATLVNVLQQIASGILGSNVVTFTVSSPKTLEMAKEAKGYDYDLIRVRMGGWTEYFCVLSDTHKDQHIRRPLFVEDLK